MMFTKAVSKVDRASAFATALLVRSRAMRAEARSKRDSRSGRAGGAEFAVTAIDTQFAFEDTHSGTPADGPASAAG